VFLRSEVTQNVEEEEEEEEIELGLVLQTMLFAPLVGSVNSTCSGKSFASQTHYKVLPLF